MEKFVENNEEYIELLKSVLLKLSNVQMNLSQKPEVQKYIIVSRRMFEISEELDRFKIVSDKGVTYMISEDYVFTMKNILIRLNVEHMELSQKPEVKKFIIVSKRVNETAEKLQELGVDLNSEEPKRNC